MTKTTFNPNISGISPAGGHSCGSKVPSSEDKAVKSGFERCGHNSWKAMTKSIETPSVIGDMLESVHAAANSPSTARDREQAYLGGLMMGDWGNLRVADNKNVRVGDHEEIAIPDVKKLFVTYPSLQENTFPLLERLTLMHKTIQALIDTNTETLKRGGISASEAQGIKDYLNYLYDCMHNLQHQLDIVDFYRQNELARRKEALSKDDNTWVSDELREQVKDVVNEANSAGTRIKDALEDSKPRWWW